MKKSIVMVLDQRKKADLIVKRRKGAFVFIVSIEARAALSCSLLPMFPTPIPDDSTRRQPGHT
jgi:hypothetical protein